MTATPFSPARWSPVSTVRTTICLRGVLLEHELTAGNSPEVTAARVRGQAYLLERRLFRRRPTGAVIARDRKGGAAWATFAFPRWWHYDVLRGSTTCATPRSHPASAWPRRSRCSRPDPTAMTMSRSRSGTSLRCRSIGRGRGPAELVDHASRFTRLGLVLSPRLAQTLRWMWRNRAEPVRGRFPIQQCLVFQRAVTSVGQHVDTL